MILSPAQYAGSTTRDLLVAAARGHVGIDQRWLRAILDRGEDVLDDFVQFLDEDEYEDYPVDISRELLDVARHLNSPRALPFLIDYAAHLGYDFTDALIEAFIPLGEAAVEPLLRAYEEGGEPSDVSFTLASLGVRDPRILDTLTAELAETPVEASISLVRYGDPAARPAIEKALASTNDETATFALKQALAELGQREPEPVEPFDIWETYPEESPPAFDILSDNDLIAFLDSPEAEYRAAAAGDLGLTALADKVRGRLLDMARSDPAPSVRGACWEALGDSELDEALAAELRARLDDPSVPAEERAGAAVGLASVADQDEHIRRVMIQMTETPATRAQAIRGMWKSMDRRFGDVVARYLNAPDFLVRREALAAAGWLGLTAQVGLLEKAMQDGSVRDIALHSYALAAPGETSPARMRSLFRKIEDLAGGLSSNEAMIVESALDSRLQMHGYEPEFADEDHDHDPEAWAEEDSLDPPFEAPAVPEKVGRNEPCPCGSGKKYKKCCGK